MKQHIQSVHIKTQRKSRCRFSQKIPCNGDRAFRVNRSPKEILKQAIETAFLRSIVEAS